VSIGSISALLFAACAGAEDTAGPPPPDTDGGDTPSETDPPPSDTDTVVPPGTWSADEVIPLGMMPEDGLFRLDKVTDIKLTLTPRNRASLESNPTGYVPAEMRMYGTTLEIGMRLKGSSTLRPLSDKPSMKIAVDFSTPGQEVFGWEGFNLHNCVADDSYMGDVMAHHLLREAGVPSLRTGYANVWVDNEYKGLYAVVQRKDHDWLEEWFADASGSLYEGLGCDFGGGGWGGGGADCWNLDQQGLGDTRQDLNNLVNNMNRQGNAFLAALVENFDAELLLRALAAEWVIGHWDSYSGNLNNYHLYHEPTTGKWSLSPWSLDLAFGRPVGGVCHQFGLDRSNYRTGQIALRCQNDPECNAVYEQFADEVMTVIESYPFNQTMTDIENLIDAHVVNDPFGPGRARWRNQVQCVRDFLTNRRAELGL
jgi:hypothetical protein